MLRTFNDGNKPQNIIYLSGATHTSNAYTILNIILGIQSEINNNNNDDDSCIRLDKPFVFGE